MSVPDEKLTLNQEKALIALLAKGTVKAAAKEAKVSEATLFRWLALNDFQSRYRAARRQLVEVATSQLQSDCTAAVKVLREAAENKKAPASARVTAAAKTIIEQSIKAVELVDLTERMDRLEQELERDKGKRKR